LVSNHEKGIDDPDDGSQIQVILEQRTRAERDIPVLKRTGDGIV
jgi:hypothetical protein